MVNHGAGADFLVHLDRERKKVVDSIRWEPMRQTSQDYEMLHMLQQRGGDSQALCRQLVRGFTDYETAPAKFARARHRLMTELDRRMDIPGRDSATSGPAMAPAPR